VPVFALFAVSEPTVCPLLGAVPLGSCPVRVGCFGGPEATGTEYERLCHEPELGRRKPAFSCSPTAPLFALFAVFEPTVCLPFDAVPLGSCLVRVGRFGGLEATGAGFVGVRSRRCGVSKLYTFSLFPTLPMSICVY